MPLRPGDPGTRSDPDRLERRVGSGAYQLLAPLAAAARSYADTGLVPGVTYTYRVFALSSGGSSSASNEASQPVPAGILQVGDGSTVLVRFDPAQPLDEPVAISNRSGTQSLWVKVRVSGPFALVVSGQPASSQTLLLAPNGVTAVSVRYTGGAKGGIGQLNVTSSDPSNSRGRYALVLSAG